MLVSKAFLIQAAAMLLVASGLAAPTQDQGEDPVKGTRSVSTDGKQPATSEFFGGDISHLGTLMSRGSGKGVWEERTNREEAFVQDTLSNLSNLLPEKNILIFHDQKSESALSGNPYHEHFELNVDYGGRKLTKGFEIWIFDGPGVFFLHGEGGWRNWGVTGCYERTGDKSVEFFEVRTKCPELYAQKHYVYTTDNTPPTLADIS